MLVVASHWSIDKIEKRKLKDWKLVNSCLLAGRRRRMKRIYSFEKTILEQVRSPSEFMTSHGTWAARWACRERERAWAERRIYALKSRRNLPPHAAVRWFEKKNKTQPHIKSRVHWILARVFLSLLSFLFHHTDSSLHKDELNFPLSLFIDRRCYIIIVSVCDSLAPAESEKSFFRRNRFIFFRIGSARHRRPTGKSMLTSNTRRQVVSLSLLFLSSRYNAPVRVRNEMSWKEIQELSFKVNGDNTKVVDHKTNDDVNCWRC